MQFVIYLALLIVSTAISYALAPKPESPNPASLDDFDFIKNHFQTGDSLDFSEKFINFMDAIY